MKVLLVLPHHYIHNLGYLSYKDSDYPLGIGYVAAVIRKCFQPEKLDVYDFQLKSSSFDGFTEKLKKNQYDIVGISVFTPTYGPSVIVSKKVKETLPNCTLLAGGPFTGMNPGEMIKECHEVDIEVIGESEETIPELFEAIVNRRSLNGIMGIAHRDGGKVIINKHRPLINNLDSIPLPVRDIFNLSEYTSLPGQFFKKPIMPMTTSRGCPFRCAFCEDHVLWQGKFRFRSAENVYEEMEELVKKYGAKEIKFFDDTFSANRKRVVELCELIIKRKLKIIWRVCTRVDTVDEELFKLMYKAGLRSVNFGIESGSNKILKAMNKRFTKDDVRRAVAASKKAGVETKASFILNYPGDTIETTLETLAFANELRLDFVGYNLFNPLLGKQLKEYVERNYKINESAWNDRDVSAVNTIFFYQDSLPTDFLIKVYKEAMRGYYLRPRNVIKAILRIRNFGMAKSYFEGFTRLFKIKVSGIS